MSAVKCNAQEECTTASMTVWSQWPADRKQFIPNASTWLNGDRWNDDIEHHSQNRSVDGLTDYERSISNAVNRVRNRTKNAEGMGSAEL